jgi:hypothetical protein
MRYKQVDRRMWQQFMQGVDGGRQKQGVAESPIDATNEHARHVLRGEVMSVSARSGQTGVQTADRATRTPSRMFGVNAKADACIPEKGESSTIDGEFLWNGSNCRMLQM